MTATQSEKFHAILRRFKFDASFNEAELAEFQRTTLDDLKSSIADIQRKQASERKLRNMNRLSKFLESIQQYGNVIEVFVNTPEVLGFIWGPMKVILQVSSNLSEAFDALLDAYSQIGDSLPLLSQYERLFQSNPHMLEVLFLLFEDILAFHQKALKYFKQPMWKQLFTSTWKTLASHLTNLLEKIHRYRSLIESQANLVQFEEFLRARESTEAEFSRLRESEQSRRLMAVHNWLSAANADVDQEIYASIRRSYPGTGNWILTVDLFQTWFDPSSGLIPSLWLTGIPGAGKTILASLVIEEARKLTGTTVAFFYCKYGNPRCNNFLAVARGILSQLLHQDNGILPFLYEKASASGEATLSTTGLAQELLEVALKNCSNRVYIILDGINECKRQEREEIVLWFRHIVESLPPSAVEGIRCLFISQDDSYASESLSDIPMLKLNKAHNERDIRTYSTICSHRIQKKFGLSDEKREHLVKVIVERAEGMFLFAKVVVQYLLEQISLRNFERALSLDRSPPKLDQAYAKIVNDVFNPSEEARSNCALKLLGLLVCAQRPLKWCEIQGAFSIDLEDEDVDWDGHRLRKSAKYLCGSLVEIWPDDTVGLVHHTAKFYLIKTQIVQPVTEDFRMSTLCLRYLSLPGFRVDLPELDIQEYLFKGYYAFFHYAISYWACHLERGMPPKDDVASLDHLAKCVAAFLEIHWTTSGNMLAVPKTVHDALWPLQHHSFFEKLEQAVVASNRLSGQFDEDSTVNEILDLSKFMNQFTAVLEGLVSSSSLSDQSRRKLQDIHGPNLFKCSRMACRFFYTGFATEQQRKEHVFKHDMAAEAFRTIDEHVRSAVSDDCDNHLDNASVKSLESIPSLTNASTISSVHDLTEFGIRQFVDLLMSDGDFSDSITCAIKSTKISANKFTRNFSRLLKSFALDLRQEAKSPIEQKSAMFVVRGRHFIVKLLIADRSYGNVDAKEGQTYLPLEGEKRISLQRLEHMVSELIGSESKEDSPEGSPKDSEPNDGEVSDAELEEFDEPALPYIQEIREFIMSSTAFTKLKLDLKAFLSSSERRMAAESRREILSNAIVQYCQKWLYWLLETWDLVEQPQEAGSIRLRWHCTCGRRFYQDVQRPLLSYHDPPVDASSVAESSSAATSIYNQGSAKIPRQPNDNPHDRKTPGAVAGKNGMADGMLQNTQLLGMSRTAMDLTRGWILLCFNYQSHGIVARHMRLISPNTPMTDEKLFRELRKEYVKERSAFLRFCKWRGVKNIHFVRFKYLGDLAAIYETGVWPPEEQRNVWVYQTCPPDFLPLVPSKHMMHQWECAHDSKLSLIGIHCVNAALNIVKTLLAKSEFQSDLESRYIEPKKVITWVWDEMPKKMGEALEAPAHEAWGIWFEEGVRIPTLIRSILLFIFSFAIMGAVVFAAIEFHKFGAAILGIYTGPITLASLVVALVSFFMR